MALAPAVALPHRLLRQAAGDGAASPAAARAAALSGGVATPARRRSVAARAAPASPAPPTHVGEAPGWAVDVVRHKLTMPQVLQHLEQLERIEAAAGARRGGAAKPASAREQHRVSWVEFSTNQVGAGAMIG